jgi:hypothetical protein
MCDVCPLPFLPVFPDAQAPQRQRVSRSTGRRRGAKDGASSTRGWKSLLRPDVNMGVPQLMSILEPNVVWEHTQAYVPAVAKEVESSATPGQFFAGFHKGGKKAHGVYEGSYWDLMGDADELQEMLRRLSKAPALLEEPPLDLPPPPELPKWCAGAQLVAYQRLPRWHTGC